MTPHVTVTACVGGVHVVACTCGRSVAVRTTDRDAEVLRERHNSGHSKGKGKGRR